MWQKDLWGLDGFFLCECIRKQIYSQDIKVIILTGYPSDENMQKAKEVGVNKILIKPVEPDVLLKEVEALLGL